MFACIFRHSVLLAYACVYAAPRQANDASHIAVLQPSISAQPSVALVMNRQKNVGNQTPGNQFRCALVDLIVESSGLDKIWHRDGLNLSMKQSTLGSRRGRCESEDTEVF